MSDVERTQDLILQAEHSNCDQLIELLNELADLNINQERASAAAQTILALHATGGFCDHYDGHTVTRSIFSPPEM